MSQESGGLVEVRVTAPDEQTADALAAGLVERRLAACAQVLGPITSVYTWEGVTERSQEWLLLVKTTEAAFDALAAAVQEQHPYEVPEVLAVPVAQALTSYAEWVRDSVGEPSAG